MPVVKRREKRCVERERQSYTKKETLRRKKSGPRMATSTPYEHAELDRLFQTAFKAKGKLYQLNSSRVKETLKRTNELENQVLDALCPHRSWRDAVLVRLSSLLGRWDPAKNPYEPRQETMELC